MTLDEIFNALNFEFTNRDMQALDAKGNKLLFLRQLKFNAFAATGLT